MQHWVTDSNVLLSDEIMAKVLLLIYPVIYIIEKIVINYKGILTSNGLSLAAWYLWIASCILIVFCSNAIVVGGKHFQKWCKSSHKDKYKFLTSFSISDGTSSIKNYKINEA